MSWNESGVSADEAVACVNRGMNIFVHGAAATPTPLLEALVRRAGLSLRQRADALIGIAHPDVRNDLRREFAETRHVVLSPT